jgi:GNAT superfamily N-acetyltransferase
MVPKRSCANRRPATAEYGFDVHFEGDVARIVADWVAAFRPGRDRCWIAERDGVRCGAVVLAHDDDVTARLRLLLVEPEARGSGLGRRLVRTCIAFARDAGYRRMVLWTHSVLDAARAIYRTEGFTLTAAAPNREWGPALTSETWELEL